MFRWLSKFLSSGPRGGGLISNMADAQIQQGSLGRVAPRDVNYPPEAAPDYIAETVEPSEAAWEREKERYREKEEENKPPDGG